MLRKGNLLVALIAGFSLYLAAPAGAARLTATESSVLAAVNSARAGYGLQPLVFDRHLERAARSHSADMLSRGYFAHGAFSQRLVSFAVTGPVIGENLAWESGEPNLGQFVVQAWLHSPEHRANLLRPGYRRIGIGVSSGTFLGHGGAAVVTADFAGN
ncbi:MAG: CAP domain-containing protein [Gaiellaceae bacterium]